MQLVRKIAEIGIAICILYAGYLMIQLTLPYTAFRKNIDFLQSKELIYHIKHWRWSFYIHVFTGSIALFAGLIQFNKVVLTKYKKTHRIVGYIYVINILLVTGPAALIMSLYANGGWAAITSFTIQAILWIVTTFIAFKNALKRKFEVHSRWMIRSYALTLAAITLRFYAYSFDVLHIPLRPVPTYITIAWLSWVPNLLIGELLIRNNYHKRLLKGVS